MGAGQDEAEAGGDEPAEPPTESSQDRILEKKAFDMGGGLDVSGFIIDEAVLESKDDQLRDDEIRQQVKEKAEAGEQAEDVAVGSLLNPFEESPDGDRAEGRAGEILRDGTVAIAPEQDSVTELAVQGERRLHWGLMVSMIVVYSAIGWLVGTNLPPVAGAIGLIVLAGMGMVLGERWIPDPSMRILGVTWVIISMKLLYGLAIDLHHWGWFEGMPLAPDTMLGVSLVSLVAVNVFIAHHHDEDAIAAQATLVTLALASGAGALFDEFGLALMIGAATVMLHGLALMRNSGNLASLGIAASNLWIGIHALSNNWTIGGLELLKFEDALLLFLLMTFVNTANATMAARFAKDDNWFSHGLSIVGLGKPGLWGVSVGLGMIGALMAIAAHRLETGYALAQVLLLAAAFGGSYLWVRGVEFNQLRRDVILPLPILLLGLVVLESGAIDISDVGISAYALFAACAALMTAAALLRHQSAVSDHVLWMGALSIILLLTILVPANDANGGAILLAGVGFTFSGLAALAILRSSPSLAGVSVLAPWIWVFCFATDLENRLVGADVIPITLGQWELAGFLLAMVVLQLPVNLHLGSTGVNLASRLVGMSELGSRARDSGVFRLWNLGFIFALLGILSVTRPDSLPAEGLLAGLSLLWIVHIWAEVNGRHQGNPRLLLSCFGVAALIAQWKFGLDAAWPLLIAAGAAPLVRQELTRLEEWQVGEDDVERSLGTQAGEHAPQPERLLSMQMGLVAACAALLAIEPQTSELNIIIRWPDTEQTGWVFVLATVLALESYLPRAQRFEKLLQPALTALVLLVVSLVALSDGDSYGFGPFWAIAALFVASGAWLAAQGEIRSGLKSIARREKRLSELSITQSVADEGTTPVMATQGTIAASGVKMLDPRMVELRKKQEKRWKRSGSTGELDLLVGDIHHRPVVVLTFVIGMLLGTAWMAFYSGTGEMMLALGASVSLLFIGLSRWRAGTLQLRLPDILGIETPIAATLAGISLTYLAARLSLSYVSTGDQLTLLVLSLATLILAGFSLTDREDLPIRIPSAVEWVLYVLVGTRAITFLLGGRMPAPFSVNPLAGDLVTWQIPWLFHEVVLIGMALVWEWIERGRSTRGLPDHRGAGGRSAIILMIAMISLGPAAIIAIALGMRRGFKWDQPAVGSIGLPLILVAWVALQEWAIPLEDSTRWVALILAIAAVMLTYDSVSKIKPPWTTAWLWDAQVLLPIAAALMFDWMTAGLVISLLGVSLLTWVSGVLQKRRGWRVIGAVNLVGAWLVAIFSIQSGMIDSISLLIMLIGTALVLGIVTWLNQAYEAELAED